MPDHDPQKVARLVERNAELTVEGRELLEFLGTLTHAVYFDVGSNKILVALPGWDVLDDPRDYLHVATEVN